MNADFCRNSTPPRGQCHIVMALYLCKTFVSGTCCCSGGAAWYTVCSRPNCLWVFNGACWCKLNEPSQIITSSGACSKKQGVSCLEKLRPLFSESSVNCFHCYHAAPVTSICFQNQAGKKQIELVLCKEFIYFWVWLFMTRRGSFMCTKAKTYFLVRTVDRQLADTEAAPAAYLANSSVSNGVCELRQQPFRKVLEPSH